MTTDPTIVLFDLVDEAYTLLNSKAPKSAWFLDREKWYSDRDKWLKTAHQYLSFYLEGWTPPQ